MRAWLSVKLDGENTVIFHPRSRYKTTRERETIGREKLTLVTRTRMYVRMYIYTTVVEIFEVSTCEAARWWRQVSLFLIRYSAMKLASERVREQTLRFRITARSREDRELY